MSQHDLIQKDTKIVSQAEFDLIDAKSPTMAANNEVTGAPENGAISGQHYYNRGDECMYYGDESQDLIRLKKAPRENVMTRAELLALKNSSSLIFGEVYVVTDASMPTSLSGAQLALIATREDQLGGQGWLIQPALNDCENWEVHYDFNGNRIRRILNHDRDIEIHGASVYTFDWTLTTAQNVKVDNDSVLNFTGGNINGLIVRDSSQATISGGDIDNVTVLEDSRLTVSSGIFRDSTVKENSTYLQNGGNNYRFTLMGDSNVTIAANTNYDNTFDNSILFRQVGTQYIRYSSFSGAVTMTIGDTYINNSHFDTSSVNTTGSIGYFTASHFRYSIVNATNCAAFLMNGVDFASYSSITANSALRVYLLRSGARNYGRYLASAGTRLEAYYCEAKNASYFQATQGYLNAQYTEVVNSSYVSNQSPNLNYVNRTTVADSSNVRFLNTAINNRVYYSSVRAGSTIYANGTSNGCFFYYCSAKATSTIRATNSNTLRMYYTHADARGNIYSQGNTAAHYMYYCHADSNSALYLLNNTTRQVRFYSVNVNSQSICRITNSTANSNIYYSSFSSYYYLYAVGSGGTRSGLRGYGRRTYSALMSAFPNGTFVQNF